MSYTNEPGAYRNEPGTYRDDPTTNPNYRVTETTTTMPVAEYHDLVRWGPILSGLVIAIATQLVLTGIGAAIGLTTLANTATPQGNASEVGTAVGIWSIISLLISLFIGGWVTARACGPMNRKTAMLNGAILWATTLAVSAWLLSTGVAGAFGLVAQGADAVINQVPTGSLPDVTQNPNVPPEQVQNAAGNAAKVGWSFALGSLLGLIAALAGSATGARSPRTATR
ncbi:hypothetical protein [Nodosilinea sp. LEGE 06152]|uniref:hypothetical protein n=1 Tax=Nodosilinea sp. LEGE 06152 TaxID=2777966 RepID=UPI001D143D3E|nr:hypothetical protein [Nodosilinea sp. LEGE 06152]